jgi:hypothetical protein
MVVVEMVIVMMIMVMVMLVMVLVKVVMAIIILMIGKTITSLFQSDQIWQEVSHNTVLIIPLLPQDNPLE